MMTVWSHVPVALAFHPYFSSSRQYLGPHAVFLLHYARSLQVTWPASKAVLQLNHRKWTDGVLDAQSLCYRAHDQCYSHG